jgi:hypothetical protein
MTSPQIAVTLVVPMNVAWIDAAEGTAGSSLGSDGDI